MRPAMPGVLAFSFSLSLSLECLLLKQLGKNAVYYVLSFSLGNLTRLLLSFSLADYYVRVKLPREKLYSNCNFINNYSCTAADPKCQNRVPVFPQQRAGHGGRRSVRVVCIALQICVVCLVLVRLLLGSVGILIVCCRGCCGGFRRCRLSSGSEPRAPRGTDRPTSD